MAAEAYNEYREIVDSEKVGPIDRRVVMRMLGGKKMSASDVLSIQRGRARLIPNVHAQLAGALLVMPTTPITAPEVAPLEADDAAVPQDQPAGAAQHRARQYPRPLRHGDAQRPRRSGLPTSILFSAA